ncbi:GNAT family N-acetyltransferase [Clostridium sp. CTA-19]
MYFKEMNISNIELIVDMYVTTFNSPPWNDEWTVKTASKRLCQMMNCDGAYGLIAYEDELICGMILGNEEQFYNGIIFNIKEFCVRNDIRNKGLGKMILEEFEKRLKNKGITEIVLFTSKDDSNEKFYKKRGFHTFDKIVMMGKEL